ncbi:MAG: serine/threonine protein kinase [Colwellia sp.]|nr:serine/threonine protein kinase [Colwellia sp.]
MKFNNALALFQHLLSLDEDKMQENLVTLIDENNDENHALYPEGFYLEVKSYIQAHQKNKEQTLFKALINEQATSLVDDEAIHQLIDKQVGYYQLTKKLGQGGMGAVYLGERNDGQIEQKVAIKFVYPSIVALAGEDFLQKEAQHLANLEHTNIAKIYTVDTTDDELPYMMMEYVEGVPIDQYCDDNKLDLKARLKLFQKVCSAVHEAHQNMVIHADIKPSNILVDKQGEPKLMDFGIARSINQAIDSEADNSELRKQYLQAVSHAYASPEQINGEQLTAACDVYSLGKMLARLIVNPQNKEFNAIVAFATGLKPSYRYTSASSFSDDVKNYLHHLPLSAVSKSKLYVSQKFINRNPKLVLSFSFIFISMTIFTFIILNKNKQLEIEKSVSENVLSFMMNTFEAGNPELSYGKTTTAKDLLIYANQNIKNKFKQQPEIKNRIQQTIAQAFSALGEYDKTLELLNATLPTTLNKIEYGSVLMKIGDNQFNLGKYDEALINYNAAYQIFINEKNNEYIPLAILMQGRIQNKQGDFDAALLKQNEALALFIRLEGEQSENVALTLLEIAQTLVNQGKYDDSLKKRIAALDIRKLLYSDSHFKIGDSLLEIGTMLLNLGRFDEAIEYQEKGIKIQEHIYGKEHPKVASHYNNIANTYSSTGDYTKAIAIHKHSINTFVSFYGENHIDVAYAYTYLANTQIDIKDFDNAIVNFQSALKITEVIASESHHASLAAINGIAICYFKTEKFKQAKIYFEKAVKGLTENNGESHPRVAISKFNLARVVIELGENDYARKLAEDSKVVFTQTYGADHVYTMKVDEFLLSI